MEQNLLEKSKEYLRKLCIDIQSRVVGSEGNRMATDFFAETMQSIGFTPKTQEFDCIDWTCDEVSLTADNQNFTIAASPFSVHCDVNAELCHATNVTELENVNAKDRILLLSDEIVQEQLMPRSFTFYNPEEHKRIYHLLENSGALAIIAATGRNPSLAGAQYPFPFIEDGDFNIPSVYMKDVDGEKLRLHNGKKVALKIRSQRKASTGCNVIVNSGNSSDRMIIICAHIDSKPGTPGAIDNATGIVSLLLIAQRLKNVASSYQIEIVALNGEDYYSVPGQMKYLENLNSNQQEIALVVNIDGAGYYKEPVAFSMYNTSEDQEKVIRDVFLRNKGIVEGAQWIQSDHGMFVKQGIPAIAITSNNMMETLSSEITHTPKDRPEIVDHSKLLSIADAVGELITDLGC